MFGVVMANQLRQIIGGSLRPGDPRRYLIEAMIGAMIADGSLDDRELSALRGQLERQDIFAGLSVQAAEMLIDMGKDAIGFAGGAERRVAAIAKALHTRTFRLTAYAMACEVCAADGFIADGEIRYLEHLRGALGVFEREGHELLEAARAGRAMTCLEHKMDRLRDLTASIVDTFVLRAIFEGALDERDQKRIAIILHAISDIYVDNAALDEDLERAMRHSAYRRDNFSREIAVLSVDVAEMGDRFWIAVYLLIGERARGYNSWREVGFYDALQRVFHLDAALMDRAMATAALFPSVDLTGH